MIEWAVATRRLAGETESGDAHAVLEFDGGILLAVVDGLGHGHDAAVASNRAVSILAEQPGDDLIGLFERCHEGLKRTRGAVMSLAAFHDRDSTVSWLGVGDVSAELVRHEPRVRQRDCLLLRGGIVGVRLPRLVEEVLPVLPGDTIVMVTDGIRSAFTESLDDLRPPQRAADRILADFGREHDDALALVARYTGGIG